jgi:nitrogen fixation NifU-like protein
MDHFKNPRNKKVVKNSTFSSTNENKACGDRISITGIVKDGVIFDIGFDGVGCVICMATASIFTEHCKGKRVEEVMEFTKDDILKMINIELGPNRLRCALLALETLKQALNV